MWFRRHKPEQHHPDYALIAELEVECGIVEREVWTEPEQILPWPVDIEQAHVKADGTVVVTRKPKFPNVMTGVREPGLRAQQPALQQTPAVWFDSAPVEPPNPVVINGLAALFGLKLPPEQ